MRLIIAFLLFSFGLSAQVGTGQWRLHVPSSKAIDVVALGDRVYTAYENGLSEYDFSSKELSVWDAVNALSDISLSCLGYSTSNGALFIGYENGNIDKIKNNSVTNIPAIVLAEIQGSKRINKIVEHGGYVFFATGFSIVKVDPVKNEVADTYYPTNGNQGIIDLAFRNDYIYAITEDRMYRGYANNIALADPAEWIEDARVPILTTEKYQDLEVVSDSLYITLIVDGYGLDTIYTVRSSGLVPSVIEPFDMEIRSLNTIEGRPVINYFAGTIIYNNDFSSYGTIGAYAFGPFSKANAIARSDGKYWIADNDNGLVSYTDATSNGMVSFSGPSKNEFYSLDWYNGKLAVASGGQTGTVQRSGVYIFEDEEWSLKDEQNMNLWFGQNIWDYLSVSIDPTDNNRIAAATYSQIPLSILDVDGQVTDTLTPYNSILEWTSLGNGNSMVTDLEYDNSGNLWVLNGYSNEPLKVYTSENEWYGFDVGSAAKSRETYDLEIDYNGNKWFTIRDGGLYGYNDNGSISNSADDQYVILNSGPSSGALPSNDVSAIAVDFDNEIWIGTDNGFAVLYNSNGAFDAAPGEYNAQRIKLEYEGNVEYVLGSTSITDIVVDGANRKWFGTENAGIILLSADGLEILEQHTMENSPLISNAILDLEIDHNTGELFIITDKGLVSYRTDATYGDPNYSNVVVFPNPARPDFNGPITIQGIMYDSDVKITDASGNLVYQTTSNGGTATWNGKTLYGDRVSTGVYLIWTAPNEGKGRKVGKVLVVN